MECANNIFRFQGILLILLISICVILPEFATGVPRRRRHYCERDDKGPPPTSTSTNPPPNSTSTNPPPNSTSTNPPTSPPPTPSPPPISTTSPPPSTTTPPPPPGGPFKPIKIEGNYPIRGNGRQGYLGTLAIYESHPSNHSNTTRALIALHDSAGYQGRAGNVRQFVDVLSASFNFFIVMPNFPHLRSWAEVKPVVETVIEHIKSSWGIQSIGIFGWSEGARYAYEAAKELATDLKAAVLLHPVGLIDNSDTHLISMPTYFILSADENLRAFVTMENILKGKNLTTGIEVYQLSNGFAGAKGDFALSNNAKAVKDVIISTGKFFESNVT